MSTMKKIKCNWDLVSVHWRDAFDGENGWTDVKEYKAKEATVVTVGWLWPDCLDGYITLVNSYFPDEVPDMKTAGMPVHIPLGMVIDMQTLKQAVVVLLEESEKQSSSLQKPPSSSEGHLPSQEILQSEASPHQVHL